MINEALLEMAIQLNSDDNLTGHFKEWTKDSLIIFHLCNIYEQGKECHITPEDLDKELSVLAFIQDVKPLLKQIGLDINPELDRATIKELILLLYIPHIRETFQ